MVLQKSILKYISNGYARARHEMRQIMACYGYALVRLRNLKGNLSGKEPLPVLRLLAKKEKSAVVHKDYQKKRKIQQ